MKIRYLFLGLVSFFLVQSFPPFARAADAADLQEHPVLIELFTTQGCADCPPADRIFEKILDENPNFIGLSCHVTYFDRGEWEDQLSQEFCDKRQAAYVSNLQFDAVYTPELIINGQFSTAGNNEKIVTSGVRMVAAEKTTLPIQLGLREKMLDISLPEIRLEKPVDIFLFSYKSKEYVKITKGQNAGQTVGYANIATYFEKLPEWHGEYLNMSVPLKDTKADGYVVVAQYQRQAAIVALGQISRHPSMTPVKGGD